MILRKKTYICLVKMDHNTQGLWAKNKQHGGFCCLLLQIKFGFRDGAIQMRTNPTPWWFQCGSSRKKTPWILGVGILTQPFRTMKKTTLFFPIKYVYNPKKFKRLAIGWVSICWGAKCFPNIFLGWWKQNRKTSFGFDRYLTPRIQNYYNSST